MPTLRTRDGRYVDTDLALAVWPGATIWLGSQSVDVTSGSNWTGETLYMTPGGMFCRVLTCIFESSPPVADFITPAAAAYWLKFNRHVLPKSLEVFWNRLTK
jgi:hypothetical protein